MKELKAEEYKKFEDIKHIREDGFCFRLYGIGI